MDRSPSFLSIFFTRYDVICRSDTKAAKKLMDLFKMSILLLFLLASRSRSCTNVRTNCNDLIAFETKNTVDQVIADIDQNLQDRLLKVQEHHLSQSTKSAETCTDKTTNKNEVCKSLGKNSKVLYRSYDERNMIYTCTKSYAFNVTQESRQIRCEFVDSKVELVYEVNGTNRKYIGELTCHQLNKKTRDPCPYTCAETAECIENKLVCACLKGYIDVSPQYNKSAGSICTKCNNSGPHGTDYVMLFDLSSSITEVDLAKMIDFHSNVLNFIDIDHSDNRFALIEFTARAKLTVPLVPKASSKDILALMRAKQFDASCGMYCTNTPDALKFANDEVYAKLDRNSTKPRVTILFTDGSPNNCFSEYIGPDSAPADECITKDLQSETHKMRETFKAKIITIYIGRETYEKGARWMREITSEDDELSVENFDDLKDALLDQLQIKIC